MGQESRVSCSSAKIRISGNTRRGTSGGGEGPAGTKGFPGGGGQSVGREPSPSSFRRPGSPLPPSQIFIRLSGGANETRSDLPRHEMHAVFRRFYVTSGQVHSDDRWQ
jgi:hypothetical protein